MYYSRHNPFGLLVALDSNHIAHGKLYWDNGDVLDPLETKRHNLINFSAEQVLRLIITLAHRPNC